MVKIQSELILNLQMFADGGASGGGAAGTSGSTGVTGSDAGSQNGTQDQGAVNAAGSSAEANAVDEGNDEEYAQFRAKYEKRLNEETQKAVRDRVKNLKPKADKYDKSSSIIEKLAMNMGLDPDDFEGISKALEDDTSGIEARAEARGVTVEVERHLEELEAQSRKNQKEAEARSKAAKYAAWARQADELKQLYPSFDLDTEGENPRFTQLLSLGWSVKDSYEAVHGADIRAKAMQVSADHATTKVMSQIRSNASRPSEAALGKASAQGEFDINSLTREQRDKINKAVSRGVKITDEMLRSGKF